MSNSNSDATDADTPSFCAEQEFGAVSSTREPIRRRQSVMIRSVQSWPVSVALLQTLGGRTALQCAAAAGSSAMVCFLLAHGADATKEHRAVPPHFVPDAAAKLNSEIFFALDVPREETIAPCTLAWARNTRFFSIRPIACVLDNPQLINVLSPACPKIPRFPPLALDDSVPLSINEFDKQRTINFFCIAEKRFTADGDMTGHRILWRYELGTIAWSGGLSCDCCSKKSPLSPSYCQFLVAQVSFARSCRRRLR